MNRPLKTNCEEAIKLLEEIRNSKEPRPLNKLGEWRKAHPEGLLSWEEKDLKFILR